MESQQIEMIEFITSFARNFIKIQLEEEKKCEIERVKYEKMFQDKNNIKNDKKNAKKLKAELKEELKRELKAELKEELKAELKAELKEELKAELKVELKSELKAELKEKDKKEDEEKEEDDVESLQLQQFNYYGRKYYKDQNDIIYSMGDGKLVEPAPIGKWNNITKIIEFYQNNCDEEDEEDEEYEEDEDEEDEEDETASIQLEQFKFQGKPYFKDNHDIIYSIGDRNLTEPVAPIGKWNHKTRIIEFNEEEEERRKKIELVEEEEKKRKRIELVEKLEQTYKKKIEIIGNNIYTIENGLFKGGRTLVAVLSK